MSAEGYAKYQQEKANEAWVHTDINPQIRSADQERFSLDFNLSRRDFENDTVDDFSRRTRFSRFQSNLRLFEFSSQYIFKQATHTDLEARRIPTRFHEIRKAPSFPLLYAIIKSGIQIGIPPIPSASPRKTLTGNLNARQSGGCRFPFRYSAR